jgi:2'-5' RNA ligase
MFMIHLTVADFFECQDSAIPALDSGLGSIAAQSLGAVPQFPLEHHGVATFGDDRQTVFLDFKGPRMSPALWTLHNNVIDLLEVTPGVQPNLRCARSDYRPHLSLMQSADLSSIVWNNAVEFASGVVAELQMPLTTHAWQLQLVQFESAAADSVAEGWDNGLWAQDLRWELLSSYPL